MESRSSCPYCGTPISFQVRSEELCPVCLLELALSPVESEEDLGTEGVVPDGPSDSGSPAALGPGRLLGRRYRIRASLGRGGMGEVWRAFDLKLRIDVALKSIRRDLRAGRRAHETLRREVRAARQVSSPNVCRVFDLVEIEGHELVSMEYVDGATLAELLRERGPLPLGEAQEIASQLLAGLTAIHEAGLDHRDLKPENVMRTRTGRVVVMDLGLARGTEVAPERTRAGTPHYMAPEQDRGDDLDLRADIFSVGVLLAEMVAPGGVASEASRRAVWTGLAHDPPQVGETPWSAAVRRAVAPDRDGRFESALELARELEEATRRAVTTGDRKPYPGLSSFAEEDAGYFFGREVEIEALWRKLRRPGLLGVIGPSGAGKSSFLRAGLVPARPSDWGGVVLAPGDRPLDALSESLRAELEREDRRADTDLRPSEGSDVATELFARWRQPHAHALVVVDQFEELFTRCPEANQEVFVSFLHRLSLDRDVHVLLAMRDDFLFQCHRFEELRPIFADLTPLGAPTGAALRRALVQPALKCGYRFEDEALVETMIAEVEGERGALPLLAFACAQLWERRDREHGVLTRASYEEIGGVAGALAQHAESTLEEIGRERLSLVREIFRNLVTAQGTRAARERAELLSVFAEKDRTAVAGILDALVASRLVVSYEAPGKVRDDQGDVDGRAGPERAQRLEIVHESLLTKWPRLVQWRAQDEEGAVLRDQLREAARLWQRHHRAEGFLWSETAYREFRLWRERYPGGLTQLEEEFASAMSELALRRTRRRRIAIAGVIALLAAALAALTFLRQQAVSQARRAEDEAVRAESSKLLALGQVELEGNPTAALAYALKSLELTDNHEARVFALRALAAGPIASLHPVRVQTMGPADRVVFSADGVWAAVLGLEKYHVLSSRGGAPVVLDAFPSAAGRVEGAFDSSGNHFFAAKGNTVRVWHLSTRRLLETQVLTGGATRVWSTRAGVLAAVRASGEADSVEIVALAAGAPPWRIDRVGGSLSMDVDAEGRALAFVERRGLFLRELTAPERPTRRIGTVESGAAVRFFAHGDRFADYESSSGAITIRAAAGGGLSPVRRFPTPLEQFVFDRSGRRLAAFGSTGRRLQVDVWDLEAPIAAAAWSFPAGVGDFLHGAAFAPDGRWLATANYHAVCFWPVPSNGPRIFHGHQNGVVDVRFTPDGRRILSVDRTGEVREWSLSAGARDRVLTKVDNWGNLDVDPAGRFIAVTQVGGVRIVPLGEGEERNLRGFGPATWVMATAIDREGRRVAAASLRGPRMDKVIRVWNLESGDVVTLGQIPQAGEAFVGMNSGLGFLADGSLVSTGTGGVLRWSLQDGTFSSVGPSFVQSHLTVFPDGRSVVHVAGRAREAREGGAGHFESTRVAITDLVLRETRVLPSHGDRVMPIAVDPTGTIVASGGLDTIVRVGPVSGEQPYLLIGHDGPVHTVDISRDGRWIASGGDDRTVRVWPMPDLSRPPLHTLPLEQLLARLRSLTNVRIVKDSESTISSWLRTERGGGYELELEPFPGWGGAVDR